MASIHLTTFIAAPIERVFDLSRHLAIYKQVFQSRKAEFRSGAASSLLSPGETISVLGKIAGKNRMTMLKLTKLQRPLSFTEEQVKGDLESYKHEHHFKPAQNGTIVIDILEYGPPRDMIGRIVARIRMKKYLEEFIGKRNETIRNYAETEKWRAVLT
jgi:ligand-binding SRPBCC domain-containing protein